MCQPKPGPRCSRHTSDRIKRILTTYEGRTAEMSPKTRADLKEEIINYDSTPEGQKWLRYMQHQATTYFNSAIVEQVRERIENGEKLRAAQLLAVKKRTANQERLRKL